MAQATYIRNCIIAGNGGYSVRHGTTGVPYDYISYSCVYGNTSGNFFYNYNNYRPRLEMESGVFCGYPVFAGATDYHLQGASPCVDTGADLSGAGVTNDLAGVARSAPFDIGCYQSSYSAATKYTSTYVDAGRPDDSGAGTNSATAKKTIGAGLAVTDDNGTCYVSAGTYGEGVIMPANVTLEGTNWQTTILTNSLYVVTMSQTNSTLRELTVAGGQTGVAVDGPQTTANTMERCIVRDNAVGVLGVNDGIQRRFTVSRCMVTNNTSHGLYALTRCAIVARNCLIADNGGDGIQITSDNCTYKSYIDYCTIANNAGNGYYDVNNWHQTTYITNCIVVGNGGYGVRHAGGMRDDYIAYSCVYSNAGGDLSGARLIQLAGMITNQLPMFVDSGYSLQRGSPCIDTAFDLGVTVDVNSVTRPIMVNRPVVTDGYDIGAIEANPPPTGLVITIR